jgi:Protein of unknown function (DUF2975)
MRSARVVVRLAALANRLFLLPVTAGLLLSWLLAARFAELVRHLLPGSDVPSAMTGMRLLMMLGIAMSAVSDRVFAVLADIIGSAAQGDPFIAANAGRLRKLGWYLLALQACELPGALIARGFPSMGSAAPSGEISIAGWLSVLMVFVLSRVFAAGAAMRDELAGTV